MDLPCSIELCGKAANRATRFRGFFKNPYLEACMRYIVRCVVILAFSIYCVTASLAASAVKEHKTKNIIFVMTDGLRWQEVFEGADSSLMNKENGGVEDVAALQKAYGRDSVDDRRTALMPFLWSVIAKDGQIYGNRTKGSDAYVTNNLNFSYPGYSETLCGFADARVNSNDKIPNPNVTVLEWLNGKKRFHGKVGGFGAWDAIPYIINAERADFPVSGGYDPFISTHITPRLELLNQLKAETPRVWEGEPFDPIPFYTALEYLRTEKPRVLYLSLGETDEWAHAGNYTEYLNAAHRADAYLRILWETVQSMPQYRGKTTLIFSPDHGRGNGLTEWRSHGEKLPDSKCIWMAFLGPDTPALSERSNIPAVTADQIAATLAALLGKDYVADVSKAGKPIADVLPSRP
jgi:hypothetical protein